MPGIYRHPPQPWQLPPHVIAPPDIASQTPIPSRRNFPGGGSIGSAIRGFYPIPTRRRIGKGAITSAALSLFIAGKSKGFQINTLNIVQPLSQAATAVFDIWDKTGTYHPIVGQEVFVYAGSLRIFGGTIDEVTEAAKPGLTGVYMQIKCVDFSNVLDRHVVAKYYSATQAALTNMIADVVSTDLSTDGIIYDSSDGNPAGVTFGPQLFNWVTIRQMFNTLSNIAKWDFNIDYYKVLRFFPQTSGRGTAPFNISDGDSNVIGDQMSALTGTTSMSVRTYRTAYRNRQFVQSSTGQNPVWTDIFSTAHPGPYPAAPQPPDGVRIAFVTKYGLIATPSVAVNGVPKRVIEINQIATTPSGNWDWYWQAPAGGLPAGLGVFQNQAQPPLISTDVLTVGYPTQIAPVTQVDCPAQIAARAAVEGNSGIYADVQNAANVTDPAAITAYAQGLLDRYGCLNGMPVQVIYATLHAGLFAGQIQTIQRTSPLIVSNTYQISNVSIRDHDGQYLMYQITADLGRYQGNWTEFYGAVVASVGLPQPQNRMAYQWSVYPTVPGIVNPGGTGGVQLQTQVIANPFEIFQYLQVSMATPLATQLDVQINVNGSTTGSFTIPAGVSVPQTFYYPQPQDKRPAGASLQVVINPHGSIADLTVQLVTSVVVSA
jgi:hypothetical protein